METNNPLQVDTVGTCTQNICIGRCAVGLCVHRGVWELGGGCRILVVQGRWLPTAAAATSVSQDHRGVRPHSQVGHTLQFSAPAPGHRHGLAASGMALQGAGH